MAPSTVNLGHYFAELPYITLPMIVSKQFISLHFIALDSLSFLCTKIAQNLPRTFHTFVITVARTGVMFTPMWGDRHG